MKIWQKGIFVICLISIPITGYLAYKELSQKPNEEHITINTSVTQVQENNNEKHEFLFTKLSSPTLLLDNEIKPPLPEDLYTKTVHQINDLAYNRKHLAITELINSLNNYGIDSFITTAYHDAKLISEGNFTPLDLKNPLVIFNYLFTSDINDSSSLILDSSSYLPIMQDIRIDVINYYDNTAEQVLMLNGALNTSATSYLEIQFTDKGNNNLFALIGVNDTKTYFYGIYDKDNSNLYPKMQDLEEYKEGN